MYDRRYNLSYIEKEEVRSIYENDYKQILSKTCSNAYADAIVYIMLKIRKNDLNADDMEISNYKLKNGVLVNTFDCKFSNQNITDELAEKYLLKFPNKINLFSQFPDDWQKRVKQEKEVEDEITEDSEVEESETLNYESESDLKDEISQLLKDGASKNSIQKKFKGATIMGVRLSNKEITELIKKAE